jgi:hypothetical protein
MNKRSYKSPQTQKKKKECLCKLRFENKKCTQYNVNQTFNQPITPSRIYLSVQKCTRNNQPPRDNYQDTEANGQGSLDQGILEDQHHNTESESKDSFDSQQPPVFEDSDLHRTYWLLIFHDKNIKISEQFSSG